MEEQNLKVNVLGDFRILKQLNIASKKCTFLFLQKLPFNFMIFVCVTKFNMHDLLNLRAFSILFQGSLT